MIALTGVLMMARGDDEERKWDAEQRNEGGLWVQGRANGGPFYSLGFGSWLASLLTYLLARDRHAVKGYKLLYLLKPIQSGGNFATSPTSGIT